MAGFYCSGFGFTRQDAGTGLEPNQAQTGSGTVVHLLQDDSIFNLFMTAFISSDLVRVCPHDGHSNVAYYCIVTRQLHTGENWESWDLLPAARLPSNGSSNTRPLRVGRPFSPSGIQDATRTSPSVLVCSQYWDQLGTGTILVLGRSCYWDDLAAGTILLLGCLAALGCGDCQWDVSEPC